jgi:hypothetical protein
VAGVAALALALSSCSLDVFDPDVVSPDDVSDPASLPIAVTGAIGDLQFALDDYALYSGLFTDEFLLAGTFPTRQEVDERRINFTNTTLNTELYELMHSSRFSADNLVASAQSLVGNEEADQDLVQFAIANGQYAGAFIRMLFAEMYCESIFGGNNEEDPSFETAPVDPVSRMQEAVTLFQATRASATANGLANLAQAALVGEARAQMFLGNYSAAATAAATVDAGLVYISEYSSNTIAQYNEVYNFTYADGNQVLRWTVGDGTLSSRFNEAWPFFDEWVALSLIEPNPDPVTFTSFDSSIPVKLQMIYPPPGPLGGPQSPPTAQGQGSPISLATGFEADIMEAEAAYRAGALELAAALINSRLTTGDNPHGRAFEPVAFTGDFASDIAEIGRAYAAGTWLTGHRLGFMRRVIRNDGVDLYPQGKPGSDTAFPMTKQEVDNNGNISTACSNGGPPWN